MSDLRFERHDPGRFSDRQRVHSKAGPGVVAVRFALLLLFIWTAAWAEARIIEVAFSPNAGATHLVVKTIDQAKQTIRVAAYSFTSMPIGEALVVAHNRGVDVKVVLDKSQLQ